MQRKKYSAAFKAKVALELAKEHQTLNEVATKYSVHPDMISKWKKQLLENLSEIFSKNGQKGGQDNEKLTHELFPKTLSNKIIPLKKLRKTFLKITQTL